MALIVIELLRHGARTIESDPPERDTATLRQNWGRFPVRFTVKGTK
ncbi:hypothetical protein [Novosphingobium sp. THN1]|nr:hypothetical protein [Novosphingobium sp. THN1]